jgi:hypothetical protein
MFFTAKTLMGYYKSKITKNTKCSLRELARRVKVLTCLRVNDRKHQTSALFAALR